MKQTDFDKIQSLLPKEVKPPYQVLAMDASQTHHIPGIQFRGFASNLPPGSLIMLSEDIGICSPALTFVQYAADCDDLLQTILLGYEFCGTYRFNSQKQMFQLEGFSPITTVKEIRQYLNGANRLRGLSIAKSAINFICDNSASPMESSIVLLLCLPWRMGGYNLPFPQMNYKIKRKHNTPDAFGRTFYKADLCWPEQKVCVEYDSDSHHGNVTQMAKDSAKRAALTEMGYTVVELTRPQVVNMDEFDNVAKILSKALGITKRNRLNDFRKRQVELRKSLFKPLSEYI